jgi:uncharacterized protein YycO
MIGDIILQKRSGWLGWFVSLFTRSDYVHVGIDMGNEQVAHVYFAGKQIDLVEEWGNDIIVLTPVVPLSDRQKEQLEFAIYHAKVRGYDYFSAVRSWLWKNTNDEKPNGRRYHCSEFVSAMYRKGLGIDLVAGRSDDTTQPQDFLKSPYLRRVSQ